MSLKEMKVKIEGKKSAKSKHSTCPVLSNAIFFYTRTGLRVMTE